MSDSEEESVQRPKKQLSEAKLRAIEKMKEGRKRSLELKKKQKEEEKQKKKDMKKAIKLRVEEEMNGLSSLPTDDKEFMEDLRKKAVGEIKIDETQNEIKEIKDDDAVGKILKDEPFSSTESHSPVKKEEEETDEEEIIEIKQPIKKRKPRKKKVVVNNYYDDDEDGADEIAEEVVNNYHRRRRTPKPRPIEESSDDEDVYDEPPTNDFLPARPQPFRINSAMDGIVFR